MKPQSKKSENLDKNKGSGPNSETLKAKLPNMNEGRFRLAFENAPIGMAIVDFDFRLRRVNRCLCEALGYTAHELLEKRFIDITHPDDIKKDKKLAEQLFRGELPTYKLEKRFLRKDGSLAWLSLTAVLIRDETHQPIYGFAMVENITDRKRSQEALRTSEERYRSFVVNSSEGIWRLEVEHPIAVNLPVDDQIGLFYKHAYLAECNDAMARMYGRDRADDIVGLSYADFAVASHPASVSTLRKFINSNYRLMNLQTEIIDAHGARKFLNSSLIGIIMHDQLLRVWGVQRDQTEQHKAELALEHSHHQLRALTAYLNSIRERERVDLSRELHDVLGQALTGINIELSLLKKKITHDEHLDRRGLSGKLDEINQQVSQALASVKALSTELRPGVLDKFGLVAAIEWQCEEFTRRYNIKSECSVPKSEFDLSPDLSTALFRILQEALINVARHSGASKVKVIIELTDAAVTMTIKDDGRGITIDKIEAPSSLGLLGMRERVEFLGGRFTISGSERKGTTITVRAPLSATGPRVEAGK